MSHNINLPPSELIAGWRHLAKFINIQLINILFSVECFQSRSTYLFALYTNIRQFKPFFDLLIQIFECAKWIQWFIIIYYCTILSLLKLFVCFIIRIYCLLNKILINLIPRLILYLWLYKLRSTWTCSYFNLILIKCIY